MKESVMQISIGAIEVKNLAETAALGGRLAKALEPGDVLALDGDLGAGKTTLTAALAAALGISEPVTSPTFALAQSYACPAFVLHHLDAYRLRDEEEFAAAGLADLFDESSVTIIEWARRVSPVLPKRTLFVQLSKEVPDRNFEVTAGGQLVLPPDTSRRSLFFSSRSKETADRFKEALYAAK